MGARGLRPKGDRDVAKTKKKSVKEEGPIPDLTLGRIIHQNEARANRWHPNGIEDWSTLEWAGATAGEAGEMCNAAKKLKRLETGLSSKNKGSRNLNTFAKAQRQVGLEGADTILYAILTMLRADQDVEECIRTVFNAKSEEYGFPERL